MVGFGEYSITDILNGMDGSLVLAGDNEEAESLGPDSGLDGKSLVLTQGQAGLSNNLFGISGSGGLSAPGAVSLINSSGQTGFGVDPVLFGPPAGVAAANPALVVTTTKDVVDPNDGVLSLREAVQIANDNPGEDEITFDSNLLRDLSGVVQIDLKEGELNLTDDTLIRAEASSSYGNAVIGTDFTSRHFNISGNAHVTMENLTLYHGFSQGDGGSINIVDGVLTIHHSSFLANQASGNGGAIAAHQTNVYINNSRFTDNFAGVDDKAGDTGHDGGAMFADSGFSVIIGSSLDRNSASGRGGNFFNQSGFASVENSTFYGGKADSFGNSSAADQGGNVFTVSGLTSIDNSVLAKGTSGTSADNANDIADGTKGHASAAGSFFSTLVSLSGGTNSIGSGASSLVVQTGGYTDANGNIINGGDPMLGEPLDNGGGVLTMSPLDGSPLIDAGSNIDIPGDTFDLDNDGFTFEPLPLDARGASRIIGGTVDIGAVEYMRNEKIGGTDEANHIIGGLGKDTMSGLGGADTIDGGPGNDRANGGAGGDLILGRDGNDILNGNAGGDTVDAGAGNDRVNGGGGHDSIDGGAGDDTVNGNRGNDHVSGNAGADVLTGGFGNDSMSGGAAGDVLRGAAGDDSLNGGGGHDSIDGGAGDDSLSGGATTDTFAFSGNFGHDTISDFSANNHEDIDLSGVSGITGFLNLITQHLNTGPVAGSVVIDDGAGHTIVLLGFTTNDFGAGKDISGADFIFA